MSIILIAVIPTLLLMVLGNLLRRSHFLGHDFWAGCDKLTYFVLFPALLIAKVSQVDLATIDFPLILGFIAVYFFVLSVIVVYLHRFTRSLPTQFSSMYQGIIRFNSFIFFAIIESVGGHDLLALGALFAGLVIPLLNICCVAAFSVSSGSFQLRSTLLSLLKNPLILAAAWGFVCNLFPALLPIIMLNTLLILSKAALPLALLSVGAAVQVKMLFVADKHLSRKSLWLTTLVRLTFAPAIAWAIAAMLGIDGEMLLIIVLFAAVPTATSSYILAKQLGGDAVMMASLISLQTVLSALSLVFWLHLLL